MHAEYRIAGIFRGGGGGGGGGGIFVDDRIIASSWKKFRGRV